MARKKWGRIGSPHSKKRKLFLARIRRMRRSNPRRKRR